MNLANEVSSLVSELESLRCTNETLKNSNSILEFENTQLHKALDKALSERDHHMTKKAELKTLLDQTGAQLVSGIQKFHEPNPELPRTQVPELAYDKQAEAAVATAVGAK